MTLYETVMNEGVAEQIIEKSRFIAHVMPVESKEEADEFIKLIKEEHKGATHNVPAMVIGDKFQIQWASDDGEPSGTSGAPIVQMLVKEGITNVVIVVTRYFGGIKLGTGGLVRAYTSSAKLGLEKAGRAAVKEMISLRVNVDYSYLSIIQNLAKNGDFKIGETNFAEKVSIQCLTEPEKIATIVEQLAGVTNGKFEKEEELLQIIKVQK